MAKCKRYNRLPPTVHCLLPTAGTVRSSVSVISDLQQASLFYNYKVRSMSLKTN